MNPTPSDEVKITPPDETLRRKIGGKLDYLLSQQAVQSAEKVIESSATSFLNEAFAQLETLEKANTSLQRNPAEKNIHLPTIIQTSFSIKTKVTAGGYDLASALAKSLHLLCEGMQKRPLAKKDLELIQWHVTSLRLLLKGGLKGIGGPTGEAILMQLQLIAPEGVLLAPATEK